MPVEALFPPGRKHFELCSSGWSRVLGIDAVGGPPYCDFANEGGARVASRRCADWLGFTLAGVILDLVGEVGDQLGSLCQVWAPRPDGYGAFLEYAGARAADLGRQAPALGGASRGRRPGRPHC
jgi:hypothetical protein